MKAKSRFPFLAALVSCTVLCSASALAGDEYVTLTSKFREGYLSVAFSRGGEYVAATGKERRSPRGVLTVWDADTGDVLGRVSDFPAQCGSVVFSPTGGLLAVACGDRSIHVFRQGSVRPGSVWTRMARLPRRVHPQDRLVVPDIVCFSPDGKRLACSAYGLDVSTRTFRCHRVEIWLTSERMNAPACNLQLFDGMLTGLRFLDEQGNRLVTCETGDRVPVLRVFSLETGELESAVPIADAPSGYQPALDVSPDFQQVVVGGRGFLVLLDAESMELIRYLVAEDKEQPTTFLGVSFSPDGQIVASCDKDSIRLWEVRSGKLIAVREQEWGRDLVFSPDGSRLATIGDAYDGVRLWKLSRLIESGKSE